jgi:hypothetical protein
VVAHHLEQHAVGCPPGFVGVRGSRHAPRDRAGRARLAVARNPADPASAPLGRRRICAPLRGCRLHTLRTGRGHARSAGNPETLSWP